MMKKILISLLLMLGFYSNANAVAGTPAAVAACNGAIGGPTSAVRVLMNTITSIYNILPIKIAGVSITP